MLREIVIDYGVSSWESYLPKARLWGWLLAVQSLCFSKLIPYFLSSSKSPEVVLYPQQIVGLISLLGNPPWIWVALKGWDWWRALAGRGHWDHVVLPKGWCQMGLYICKGDVRWGCKSTEAFDFNAICWVTLSSAEQLWLSIWHWKFNHVQKKHALSVYLTRGGLMVVPFVLFKIASAHNCAPRNLEHHFEGYMWHFVFARMMYHKWKCSWTSPHCSSTC